ncbi:MAG TPA: glycosyltransferase family A protein [Pedobacter sp.]|jgi:glycosyltransferase involved in cell wall biosynthesis
MTPLVSIIIPVYNAEKYLEECLISAINQTWLNKEIIIINDQSDDGSLKILQKYSSKEIVVINQSRSGASKARNRGLNVAKGDYIQFLDADDFLSPDKIEVQIKALLSHNNKLAVCNTISFPEHTNPLLLKSSKFDDEHLYSTDDVVRFMIGLWGGFEKPGGMVQPNAWLTPRSLIDKVGLWNEKLTFDDDGEFFARVVLNSDGIIKTDGYNYYRKYLSKKNLSSHKGYTALISLLTSALTKKKELLQRTESMEAKKAIYKMLVDVAEMSYPTYKDIVKEAERNYPGRFKYTPPMGGKSLMMISNALGWKAAKWIKTVLKG